MPKVIKKYPVVRNVRLNNKSRRGEYVYVKLGKGQRGSYYKAKEGVSFTEYLITKQRGVKKKRLGVGRKMTPDRFVKKIGRRKSVSSFLPRGISTTSMNAILKADRFKMKNAYKKMFSKMRASELLDVLVQDANVDKFKHRLEHKIIFYGKNNIQLAEVTHPSGKRIDEVVSDIKNVLAVGLNSINDVSPEIMKKLAPLGYKYSHLNNGLIVDARLTTIFRKGK